MPFRRIFPPFFVLLGFVLFTLSSYPLPSDDITWQGSLIAPSENTYLFNLDWPAAIRATEPRGVRLRVQTPQGLPEGSVLIARLEFNSAMVSPSGEIIQPVSASGSNEFQWSLAPLAAGKHDGTLWVYSDDSLANPAAQRQAIISRPVEFQAIFLGPLPVVWLRRMGISLLAMGALLYIFWSKHSSKHSVGLIKVDFQPANLVQHADVLGTNLHHIGIIKPARKHTVIQFAKKKGCCTQTTESR